MSFFQTEKVACPECGEPVDFDVVYSINAVLRPDLRDAILDRSFQRETCAACGHTFRVEPEMTYLDYQRKQWLLVRPFSDLLEWPDMEKYARSFFDAAFGPDAPAASRAIGKGLEVRVTFGWPAVREKLVCNDLGIDDVALELLKLSLVRNLDPALFSDRTELRLIGQVDDKLGVALLNVDDEMPIQMLPVPKEMYDDIAADSTGWAELRAQLTAGPFIDVRRLLVPVESAEDA